MTSYCRGFLNFSAHQKPTVGDTKTSYTDYDHIGWLKCDGRMLNVSDHRLLFDVVRYTFGGADTQFKLPDPAGRVIGVAGAGVGLTVRSKGSNVGEETHTLIIPEMPSHNHGVDVSGGQIASNNLTAEDTHDHGATTGNSLTSISLADVGNHTHTYTRQDGVQNIVAASGSGVNAADEPTTTDNTGGAGGHNHTITDPTHAHSIANYTHSHLINPAGGDLPHNNMQPTLFYGNMFIYCGKVNVGSFPYTTGTDLL
jgi:microcystin-dependent protein